ncbi:MAG: SufS family cysteine desulfurase [Thermoproteota archaeon]|nr:SufS family cysteine desulfurase [Candidatus Brockarchaeota archaeon]
MFDPNDIRHDFPILNVKVNGKPLIYFDNAATSQKPKQVIEAIENFYFLKNANVGRSIHTLAEEATELYFQSRKKVADFINATPEEVVFSSGTTESLNAIANVVAEKFLNPKDIVVTSILEHHSNLLPWVKVCKEKSCALKVVNANKNWTINIEKLEALLKEGAKVVSLTHVSNVLGTINPIKEVSKLVHSYDAILVVDAAQSVPHMPVDVKDLDCDFMAFGAHKMLGPMGTGVLYLKKRYADLIEPWNLGGGMIKSVKLLNEVPELSCCKVTYEDTPIRFEAGTPNVEGAVGLSAAIDYLSKLGMNSVLFHERQLVKYLLENLKGNSFEVYGPKDENSITGIVSFNLKGIHAHDVAYLLDKLAGIAVRSGHHCAQPLVNILGTVATVRASFYIYNTIEEINAFIEALKEVEKMLK